MWAAISYHPIVHLRLGPLSISPHGVGIALGFLLGVRMFVPKMARMGVKEETTFALVTRAALGSMIGARLAYVVNHLGEYGSPLEVLAVWKGGISLLGGFFGAILLGLPKMRSERLSFWKVMDAAAPSMVAGVIVGRIGDLVVGDHLGKPTDFFLGYRCPPPEVATASPCLAPPGLLVHQTALYDLISAVILLFVLERLRRRSHYDGFIVLVFAAWYGTMRIVEDFLRTDVRHLGLTGSQWTSLFTVLAAAYVLAKLRRTPRWGRWDETPSDDPGPGEQPAPVPEPTLGPVEPSQGERPWKSGSG